MHASKPPIAPGDVLGDRYRIEALLGAGGMSWVFRAIDEHLDRPVALKVLREVAVHHAGRLRREARAVAALRHPAVVSIHDLGTLPDDRPYIVLEFIPGETLAERLERGSLAPETAVALLRPVLDALAEAHAAGIVHRDLKPENLMLQPSPGGADTVRVLDFGIAAIEPTEGEVRYTQTGAVFGTPEFMAPEQALGRRPSPATDVWAMGAVLQTLITGNPPFAGKHAPEILFKVVQAEPTPLPEETPARIRRTVERCLRKAPEDRPSTAGDLAQLLYGEVPTARPAIPVATPVVAPPAPTMVPPAFPTRLMAIACGVSLLVGFVLGLVLGGGDPPEDPTPVAAASQPAAPASSAAPTRPGPRLDPALTPARTLLGENPKAALAWLDAHPAGDAAERQALRGRALLADRKRAVDGLTQLAAAVETRPDLLTPATIPALITVLGHKEGGPAGALLQRLWPASREALMDCAAKGPRRARQRAVEIVAAAGGDARAARLAALLRSLKIGDCDQRRRAAIALGKLGDPAAIPALRRANARGVLDNYCMRGAIDGALRTLRDIEKASRTGATR